ncbi:MAG: gliding motility-associated C-terminal domain-containing protein [Flavobacteriales bacterium]|nr:gliding motility-associated C-terminal domain-containing protein [Flavobacteriales bacterium]
MKKILLILSIFFTVIVESYGTHNRAGEITYTGISVLEYEVKIVIYTKYVASSSSNVIRNDMPISWGDGTSENIQRTDSVMVEAEVRKTTYVGRHTYKGPGTYVMSVIDPNRNEGVINMTYSKEVPFYIETMLKIHAFLGANVSCELLNPPLEHAAQGEIFIHNPGAFDPDGDSLSYKLIPCKGSQGLDIATYTYPSAHPTGGNNKISVNPYTGDLTWDSPQEIGEYNVAMLIEEWRDGILVGTITRDMQIFVEESDNDPPIIDPVDDQCVVAGTKVQYEVSASDENVSSFLRINLSAYGGPFEVSDTAIFPTANAGPDVYSFFSWQTTCDHIRKEPYTVTFKAEDNGRPNLVDLETVNITVLGPAPQNLSSEALGSQVHVNWESGSCSDVEGYHVYRKVDSANYVPDSCESGIPFSTGYELVKTIYSASTGLYIDDDPGLIHGKLYCYVVTGFYADGVESVVSTETCAELKRDVPIITNVTVDVTDKSDGEVTVAWSMPTELDQFSGPFEYLLYRSSGSSFELVSTLDSLTDTIFVDTELNTENLIFTYRIDFYNDATNDRFKIGSTQLGSSIYVSAIPADNEITLNWSVSAPWDNNEFVIFRENPATLLFDSIGTSNTFSFVDIGLPNETEQCYKIKSVGEYSISNIIDPIINYSEIVCATPADTEAPCAPSLKVELSDCENLESELSWNNPNESCADDVVGYNFYFAENDTMELEFLESRSAATDTIFSYSHSLSIAGCYYVTAVDSFGNESVKSNLVCVDNCPIYDFPNVFTPDNSGKNDLFVPFPYRSVESVDTKIYNRWGSLVFETTDPDIKWDGKHMENGEDCTEGTYFYVCTVKTIRDVGLVDEIYKGYVQLLRSTNVNF